MQTRDADISDGTYSDSPGYQFCKEILAVNDIVKQHTADQKSITECQIALIDAYSKLEPAMYDEEDNRDHLKIPASLCHHLDNHENDKRLIQAKLLKIETEYQLKKEKLLERKTDLTNSILIEVAKDSASEVKLQKEYEDKFNLLNTESHKLEEQYKLKQEEIDAKCSGCCLCNVSKETQQLADIKVKKDDVYSQIQKLQNAPPQKQANDDRIKLEASRDITIKQLEKLTNIDYPADRDSIQKALDDAIIKYKEDKIIYDGKVKSHFSKISKNNILMYLRAYSCYTELKVKIEEVWVNKFKDTKAEPSKADNVSILKEQLHKANSRLNDLATTLHCPDYSNLTVIDFYKNYLGLSDKEKSDFRVGKFTNSIINALTKSQITTHSNLLFSNKQKETINPFLSVQNNIALKI